MLFLLAGLCFHITQSRLGIVAILVLFAESTLQIFNSSVYVRVYTKSSLVILILGLNFGLYMHVYTKFPLVIAIFVLIDFSLSVV